MSLNSNLWLLCLPAHITFQQFFKKSIIWTPKNSKVHIKVFILTRKHTQYTNTTVYSVCARALQKRTWVSILLCHSLWLPCDRQGLSLNLELAESASPSSSPVSGPQTTAAVTGVFNHTQLYAWVLGSKLRSSCLCQWATSHLSSPTTFLLLLLTITDKDTVQTHYIPHKLSKFSLNIIEIVQS